MMDENAKKEGGDQTILDLQRGVPEALRTYFFSCYKDVYGLAMMLLNNEAVVAQKLSMEAFWLLWQRRADINMDAKVKPFLLLAARSKSLYYWQNPESVAGKSSDVRGTADTYGIPEEIMQELFAFAVAAPAL